MAKTSSFIDIFKPYFNLFQKNFAALKLTEEEIDLLPEDDETVKHKGIETFVSISQFLNY